MEHRHKARELAFKAVYSWELNNSTTFTDITSIESELLTKPVESDFGKVIFTGVLENIDEIDHIISTHLEHWEFERVDKVDLSILRISIYSLKFHNDIPKEVTINEAINISKEFGSDSSYRFINGVLDSVEIWEE